MSISRYLSQFVNYLSSSGILNPSGGGTGISSTPSNGQTLIGNGTNYTAAAITGSGAISVTPGSGTLTVASTATGSVTSIATSTGVTGGTITTSGTLSLVTTAGGVGTYAILVYTPFASVSFGGSVAGSNLKPTGIGNQNNTGTIGASGGLPSVLLNSAQSGTWQCMGYAGAANSCCVAYYGATLWMRIA